jgi:hypothetical protein
LRKDFISDAFGKVVYFNDSLENIIENIITQYRNTVSFPILYIKTKQTTGITVKYTFSYQTYFEGVNFLLKNFLKGNNYVTIDPDGGLNIKNTSETKNLTYKGDLLKISYVKRTDEIVNFIEFDNGVPGLEHITNTYQDTASITAYGKRVAYIKDSRFKHIESVDAYMLAYFEKNAKPKIVVESLRTERDDIKLFDRINISNWEKSFEDNLFVVGITYIQGGIYELRVGTEVKREEYDSSDIITSLEEQISSTQEAIPTIPEYIKETYIDSTEIRSPILKGNAGYINDILKV